MGTEISAWAQIKACCTRKPEGGWVRHAPDGHGIGIPVFLLRSYRLALPWLGSAFGALATAFGVSALTFWGVLTRFSIGQAALLVLGALLVTLVIGAYRLWQETDDNMQLAFVAFGNLSVAGEIRKEVGRVLGNFLTWGMDIEQEPDPGKVEERAEAWVASLGEFVFGAWGPGEFAMLLDSGPSLNQNPPAVEKVSGYMDHVRLLLASRAKELEVAPEFDISPWKEALDTHLAAELDN